MLLEGIFLPLTTPFRPDGRLYLHKLETNVERYSVTPASGLLVLGRCGEAAALTDEESRSVLRTVSGAAAEEKVLIANIGRPGVSATLELADAAAAAAYDAVAVESPEFALDEAFRAEVLAYFRAIADRSPLPVVLFADRHRPLDVDLMAELAQHPRIIGAVDAAASSERAEMVRRQTANVSREVRVTQVFAAVTGRMHDRSAGNLVSATSLGGGVAVSQPTVAPLKTRVKRVGFQYLAGSTSEMLAPWTAGASGATPRLGAAAPQACCEVWQAFRDGDPALALEKQQRIRTAAALMEGWPGIAALKYACDLNAYFGGRPRLPLLPLDAGRRAQVEAVLAGIRN